MIDDTTLLRRYAEERAEDAFAEFVRRQLPLVYSAALRRLGGDAHAAEDVTQTVFSTVARDARKLSQHAMLTGWLYTATRNAVIDLIRAEQRRRGREKEAHNMQDTCCDLEATADWTRLWPVLDAAMDELNGDDREAVLLRFFQDRPFVEIGTRMGLSEDAARKRVERALDKLRTKLQRHGIGSTSAALATILTVGTVSAAPDGLAASVTGTALATGATTAGATGGVTLGAGTLITFSKLQAGFAAVVIAGGAVGLVSQQQAIRELRETTANTQQQLAKLTAENAAFAQARTQAEARSAAIAEARAGTEAELEKVRAELSVFQKSGDAANRSGAASHVALPPAPPAAGERRSPPMVVGPLPATPKIQERKAYWHRRYEPFFKQRGLTPAQGERFVELKVHQEIEREEFQEAVRAANLRGDSSAVQALRSRDVGPVTRELRELLGEEGYKAYGKYESTSFYRLSYVEPLQSELASANVALSPQQADQLVEIMAKNARSVQARPTDIGTTNVMNWDAVVAQSGAILSVAQIAVLETYASRKRSAQ